MATSEATTVPTLTTRAILGFLAALHANTTSADQWVYFEELATATGYGDKNRLDAWAMHLWPSSNFKRITYEVKASRSDFLRELKSPAKRKLGLLYSNQFYFVAPSGLLKPAEIPTECGLLTFGPEGKAHYPVAAPWRETNRPSWGFMAAAFRQAEQLADRRVEARILAQFDAREERIAIERDNLKHHQELFRQEQTRFYAERRNAQ